MQAVILAGGLGTRIRKITKDKISKVMLPVNGKPFLYYILMYLKKQGIKNIVLCVGHKKETIKEYFRDGSEYGVEINYSEEQVALGTAGAIKNAEKFIMSDEFFLLNGDTYFPVNLNKLLEFHHLKNALTTMALKEVDDCYRYGKVELDRDFQVKDFVEKGFHQSGLINGGVHVMKKDILNMIKKDVFVSLEKDILPSLVGKGLYGKVFDNYFIDVGIPKDYEKAKEEFEKEDYNIFG